MSVLLERAAELDQLSGLVRRAAGGRGAAAAIEGPPGIGKTRLGEEVAASARDAGVTVVHASGNDLEQGFAFGVVRQLFEPLIAGADDRRRGALLEGAARLGLRRRSGWRATARRRKGRTRASP